MLDEDVLGEIYRSACQCHRLSYNYNPLLKEE
jgi:hypothetical protein